MENKSITVKKIKNIKSTVEAILTKFPETRDDDNLLVLKIWAHQLPVLRNDNFSFKNFARLFIDKRFVDSESITRCRRKLQEQNEELRGELWNTRHEEAENTKQEIKTV